MDNRSDFKKVSGETMRFMRGRYVADEVGNGKDELKFIIGGETILTIYIRESRFDFDVPGSGIISVSDMETLEDAKESVMTRTEPNRKPFPKERAVYSRCGMRCDLCVHYTGVTVDEELRKELKERVGRLYGNEGYGDDMMLCPGGMLKDCGDCPDMACAKGKGFGSCPECPDFPCGNTGIVTCEVSADSTSAEDITMAVLPYVDGQYGN